ncbi:hypothetical protein TIFTF001_015382 [Ficus carica]|uniref:Uncharacterized protein n=1 Tax=Ficus carica TaxID=3494 RepID=A0AA88A131_FICCA|nr:hypothetical protein TIFTF001_015382 [Ficus carica]
MTGHSKETTHHGLALLPWQAKACTPQPPKAGHHKEKPPHASSLALLSKHASLAHWLARASPRLHLRPANLGRGHLMVPSLDEQASLALLLGKMGHPWPATT